MWVNPDEIAGNGVDDDKNGYIDDVHGINVLASGAAKGNPMDDNGHGTHTAGTLGAVGNNHIGTGTGQGTATVGVNWRAKIMRVQVPRRARQRHRCGRDRVLQLHHRDEEARRQHPRRQQQLGRTP